MSGVPLSRLPRKQIIVILVVTVALWALGAALAAGRQQPASAKPPTVDYAREVRPILQAACYSCHSGGQPQAGLHLDSRTLALKGSSSGLVIIPGNSADSRLIKRLTGAEQPRMPFGGGPLTDEQIATIKAWIDQGATGPDDAAVAVEGSTKPVHWAYVKPVHYDPPQVRNKAWVRNPIDNFILARLEKEGLSPSPEASRETLIRRVSLDLTGLPPTLAEINNFVADKSPNAYEKVVDRLLASPRYGERWARPWLDLARYADTNGYEKDGERTAWKYRDWVIDAFNQDMSFKEFTIEQIAGDMLPNATDSQNIASGFHRNSMLNQEGGIDVEEYRWYSLVDRVNTTATVWLGTTLGCAQCHDHKFDPFTQKDYYRFLAFFDNHQYSVHDTGGDRWITEPDLELPTPEQAKQEKQIKDEIAQLQSVLDTSTPQLEAEQVAWEQQARNAESAWTALKPLRAVSGGGGRLVIRPDNSVLATGKNADADTYTLDFRTDLTNITGLRLEALRDPSLPHGGPGRDADGNFFLSAVELDITPVAGTQGSESVHFIQAGADDEISGYSVQNLVNKEPPPKGWAIDNNKDVKLGRQAVLVPEKPFGFPGGTRLTIRLKHDMPRTARNLGRFRLSITSVADPKLIARTPVELKPALETPSAARSEKQKEDLAALYRRLSPSLKPTREALADKQKELAKLGIVTALVMGERQSFERPSTYIHLRGSFLAKGDLVFSGTPAALNPFPEDEMPNRLGLARWLVDDNNPLTARVTVNRFWAQFFGHGIVETEEDFGTQGERPTHPELLDWLATEFMRDGWSMKKIMRLIVTSSTYRQSSRVTPELQERDPYNRLLARGPRFRVEAEMVRDIALATSGLLSSKMHGPPAMPYQPEGVWDRPYSDEKWVLSTGEDRYRRGLYTFVRRTSPYPSLIAFDAPSREFCTVRRPRTDTPLQALTTLNDPAFFEAAQALARRMTTEAPAVPAAKAAYGFRLCTSRRPTAKENARLLAYYQQQLAHFNADPKAAAAVIGRPYSDATPKAAAAAPASADAAVTQSSSNQAADAQLAAWTMVANVMLNLDETITKE